MVHSFHLLPSVGRIQSVVLIPDLDPTKAKVDLQYTDRNNEWCQVEMPLLDALYLLTLLEGMSREQGLDYLRQPPPGSA